MSILLSASVFDALVAAGNFFYLEGYPCTVGSHHIQLLNDVHVVKRQINRLNILLALLYESWRILPYVAAIDGKAAVLITQDDSLFAKAKKFPHERFATLVSALEHVAEKVANPLRDRDLYFAPEQNALSIDALLSEAQVPEGSLHDVLPALAMNASDEVNILVRDRSGNVRPILLPATEAVRKPITSQPKKDGFWARVSDYLSVFNYLVTEEGIVIDVGERDVNEFEKGQVYFFTEVSKRTTFSKQVRHVTSDMKPQEEIFQVE